MTVREAIVWIESIKDKYIHGGDDDFDEKRKEALDMAIAALELSIDSFSLRYGGIGYKDGYLTVDELVDVGIPVRNCRECKHHVPAEGKEIFGCESWKCEFEKRGE